MSAILQLKLFQFLPCQAVPFVPLVSVCVGVCKNDLVTSGFAWNCLRSGGLNLFLPCRCCLCTQCGWEDPDLMLFSFNFSFKSPKFYFAPVDGLGAGMGGEEGGAGCLQGAVLKLVVPAVPGVCQGMGCSLGALT